MMHLNRHFHRCVAIILVLMIFVGFPCIAKADTWSFAVLADQRDNDGSVGVNRPVMRAMVNDIVQNRGVSLALVGGDIIHGFYATPSGPQVGLASQYRHWRSAMGQLLSISYPVRGNHELAGERTNPYYPYYWQTCVVSQLPQIPQNGPAGEKGMTYSFARRGAFLVGIDDFVPGNENRVNQSWLDKQLSANIMPHVFVFGHEPAVALDPVLPTLSDYPLLRDVFWGSLSDAGAQVYLAAHHHLYNRATITITDVNGRTTNPITQLVVGAGGAQYEPWSQNYPPPCQDGYCAYHLAAGQPMPPAPESVTATLNNHLENQYGYAVVTVDGNQVSITYYAGWPAGSGVPTTWYPFETFGYTVASKTLGLRDVNQTIPPRILTQFYPGIAINKVGAGELTLGAGASNYSEPMTVSAGNLSVYGDYANVPVSINYGAQTTLRGGSINDVTVAVGANMVGPGTVGNVTNDGYLCPDLINVPWSLNVIGNYAQTASGHFNVDAASTSNYGQMLVNGAAVLSGALIVTMQNGFAPPVGTMLSNVITAEGGITGTFSQVTAGGLPPDLGVIAVYTGNSVSLQVVSASD